MTRPSQSNRAAQDHAGDYIADSAPVVEATVEPAVRCATIEITIEAVFEVEGVEIQQELNHGCVSG